MISIKYFPCIPISRTKPTSVYKFYETEDRPPERYKVGVGWVEDKDLYLLIAKGELTDEDEISEDEALQIIEELEMPVG